MSLAMRPNEVNTEVQYDCKVRRQAVIFLYTEVLNMRKNLTEIVALQKNKKQIENRTEK